MCLIDFRLCEERDLECRAGINKWLARRPIQGLFVPPHDPEYGWTTELEALLPTWPHNGGVGFLDLRALA